VQSSLPGLEADCCRLCITDTSLLLNSRVLRTRMVGSLKMNTALEYSTRVVQKGDRRCKKSTLNDLAYLTPLRIPLMNPVLLFTETR
jgi:hypothetical protein